MGNCGVGRATELSRARRLRGVGAEGRHWGCGSLGAALPGQDSNDVRLKKEVTINMFLGEGVWQCVGVGGEQGVCHGGHCCASARRRLQ